MESPNIPFPDEQTNQEEKESCDPTLSSPEKLERLLDDPTTPDENPVSSSDFPKAVFKTTTTDEFDENGALIKTPNTTNPTLPPSEKLDSLLNDPSKPDENPVSLFHNPKAIIKTTATDEFDGNGDLIKNPNTTNPTLASSEKLERLLDDPTAPDENPVSIIKTPATDTFDENGALIETPSSPKKVTFRLPSIPKDDEVELRPSSAGSSRNSLFRRSKRGSKKLGHRREEDGVVSYKKIATSELMGSIQLGLTHVIGMYNKWNHDTESTETGHYRFGTLEKKRDVLITDFKLIETTSFPKSGSSTTPAHYYKEFQFGCYAPFVFHKFRHLYQILPDLYLSSLCSAAMTELSNSGASGSIFYRTKDDNFICKTVFHKEANYLQEILPFYWINFKQNPETYLPKFFGLYCYTCNTKNIRIVVMNNLMPSDVKIHQTFDLKGSTFKRTASSKERKKKSPVFKDLDFKEMYPKGIQLDAENREKLIHTLERDVRALESLDSMDYSLLLCIHNMDLIEDEQDKEGAKPEPLIPQTSDTSTMLSPDLPPSLYTQYTHQNENVRQSQILTSARIPLIAKNDKGDRLLLFVGIIDILQSFGIAKKFEHYAKSLVQDAKSISVNNPSFYRERFIKFMDQNVFPEKMEPRGKRISKRKSTTGHSLASPKSDDIQ